MSKTHTIQTNDGSNTLFTERFKAYYHSLHGAVQESEHVFIQSGLEQIELKEIRVFEMGLGTGLNAALTAEYAQRHDLRVQYTAIEAFPLKEEDLSEMNFLAYMKNEHNSDILTRIHQSDWEKWQELSPSFSVKKLEADILSIELTETYDLFYFDAFAPAAQPELWSTEVFKKLFDSANRSAVITTYCCKGQVKRNMIEAGWDVERLEGPPGKRHMLRGIKR
jgi:tRNA U34 5-methylaminomethyl-2-thiouridine-forming methyltransferase MnmC